MNKKEVLQVIRNPRSLNEGKLREVEKIAADYPYFQGAHTLVAIGHGRFNSPKSKLSLTRAALYSTDRRFFKNLINSLASDELRNDVVSSLDEEKNTSGHSPEAKAVLQTEVAAVEMPVMKPGIPAVPFPDQKVAPAEPEVAVTPKRSKFHVEDDIRSGVEEKDLNEVLYFSHDELLKEIFLNLEELKKSKSQYLEVERQLEDAEFEEAQANAVKKATNNSKKVEAGLKAKKAHTSASRQTNASPVQENEVPVLKKEKQNEIIEEFIKKNPSIKTQTTAESAKPVPVDLSAPSQKLKDELVTENLAHIYIKQGRKDKAIQVYKKLILKFPQKKAYFAAQIKELQK